jgi:hypothetical protein
MSSATGIELGPDSCLLARVRLGRRGVEIAALHVIEPSAWPSQDEALAEALRSVRRKKRFPRAARVVAWGLPEGATADDPVTRAALRPLVAAGFHIDAVLSPPQALARLASGHARTGGEAVAWLALNTYGVAIAIVRGTELLFSRAFEWSFRPPPGGTRGELLQRYSLVSHLAPEVQRGIAMVQASHGIRVETVVTCGDLPDLRSLTMPLIEELDLEVETLDSVEGLRAVGAARSDRFAELAPAVRLACAAASAPTQRRRQAGPVVRVAAALVLLAGLAWGAFTYWTLSRMSDGATVPPIVTSNPPAVPVSRPSGTSEQATESRAQQPGVGATDTPRDVKAPPPPLPRRALEAPGTGMSAAPETSVPRATVPRPPARPPVDRPTPLKEPVPVIDSILIDSTRRLAFVGGAIVSVGATIGSRTVQRIEPDFVILQEPSGLTIRVPLRR